MLLLLLLSSLGVIRAFKLLIIYAVPSRFINNIDFTISFQLILHVMCIFN